MCVDGLVMDRAALSLALDAAEWDPIRGKASAPTFKVYICIYTDRENGFSLLSRTPRRYHASFFATGYISYPFYFDVHDLNKC